MSNEFDSIIHRRSIKLDVIVPERFIWEFLESYGRAFAIRDSHQGLVFKQVDGYDYHPNGWHVTVTVADFHENKFLYLNIDSTWTKLPLNYPLHPR